MNIRQPLRSHEYGGVLITGLLTLIVLTAIGLMAARSSVMENEIVANERSYKEAFYASELALQKGEESIKEITDPDVYKKKGAGYQGEVLIGPGDMPADETVMMDATDTDFQALPSPTGSPGGTIVPQHYAENPRFSVWSMYDEDSISRGTGTSKGTNFFTVVSQGTGAKKDAKTYATTVFAHKFTR